MRPVSVEVKDDLCPLYSRHPSMHDRGTYTTYMGLLEGVSVHHVTPYTVSGVFMVNYTLCRSLIYIFPPYSRVVQHCHSRKGLVVVTCPLQY